MYTVHCLFCIAYLLCLPFAVRNWLLYRARLKRPTKLLIESGKKGWELLEYKELYKSAVEYLSAEQVVQVTISRDESYLAQVGRLIREHRPTHYVYDPRTSGAQGITAIKEALQFVLLLVRLKVTPIVLLTDFSLRLQRAQGAVVTAINGAIITFMGQSFASEIFPHRRVVGPAIMPISRATATKLRGVALAYNQRERKAVFLGALYEPRKTKLIKLQELLASKGIDFDIRGRSPDQPRITDDEYWRLLGAYQIIVTTSQQGTPPGLTIDHNHVNQLTYRYTETMLTGSLLVSEDVPEVRRYFEPGRDFVVFNTVEEAAERISALLTDDAARQAIAQAGCEKAHALVGCGTYWRMIDSMLGRDSLV